MNELSISDVVAALSEPLAVSGERRGFDKARGVPDSVFWLSPSHSAFSCRPLPVLVELEGSFAGAADDFAKFARRHGDPGYQYHLEVPIVGLADVEPIFAPIKYEVIGIRANTLTGQPSVEEEMMHEEIQRWFDRFVSAFETGITIREHLSPTIIRWELEFTMFGYDFETHVPFILDRDEPLDDDFLRQVNFPTVPGIVVVNNKFDARETATYRHTTAIEFPSIPEIRF